jgi:hypothetical protein
MNMEREKKDTWRLWDIFMSGGLFTGVAIAFAGYITSSSLERWKTKEAHTQLYAELMGKREEAESALRKDMFTSIITSFLKTEKSDRETPLTEEQELTIIEEKVLNLELLVSNFHESLNLKPLFIHLKKLIDSKVKENKRREFIERINKIAKEITRKQMLVLEGAGKSFSKQVVFDKFHSNRENNEVYPLYPNETLKVNGIERIFRIVVLDIDKTNQEIKVRLEVITESKLDEEEDTYIACEFTVGFFDFPMIDNTRLSHDQRCAVVLTDFYKPDSANPIANIMIFAFPGSHASLKEKPYYEEIVHNLLNARKN